MLFQAPPTLIRFRTKTELFCSVFKKICVHTYRFRIVFARPHYNAVSVLKTLLYPDLNACAFQHFGRQNWREIENTYGSVCLRFWILTFEWSGARVVSILMTSPCSHSIVFSVHTRKQRFQKASFSNRSTLESVFEWLRFRS